MMADAPREHFNVQEGVKRLLVVFAVASMCSIGFTTWTWFGKGGVVQASANSEASLKLWGAVAGSKQEPEAEDNYRAYVRFEVEAGERFLLFRKWTVIGHLIALASGLILWALSGFVARQKAPLTAAADPHRLTGSADTGPAADMEG